MSLFNLFRRRPAPEPAVNVYRAGSLGGEPLTEAEIMKLIRGGKLSPVFRAVVQVIERNAINAQAMALWDLRIQDGMAANYLMAESYMADILADLWDYTEGREPQRPVKQARKGKGEE